MWSFRQLRRPDRFQSFQSRLREPAVQQLLLPAAERYPYESTAELLRG